MKNVSMPRRQFLGAVAAISGGALLSSVAASGANASGLRRFGDSPYASPEGTTIPSATSFIDNGGNTWTVNGGVVYRNGSTVGNTYNVSLLLWWGGMVYARGTGDQFYVYNEGFWRVCTDPRIPLVVPAGMFYGMNGHPDSGLSPSTVVSLLQDLGCTTYRINVWSGTISSVVPIAAALTAAGITVFPVIDLSPADQDGVLFADEVAAYHYGFDGAAEVATALQPYGVTMYECGNELTRRSYMLDAPNDAGTKVSGWNNANWPLMRGVMRGMIDGVKSVQPSAQCGINFCRTDIGAADALWDGAQPDGSGGYQPLRWDITTWHNYEGDGFIFRIISDGAGPSLSVPAYVKARYGRPFMLTEWNGNNPASHRGPYITGQLGEYYDHRMTDGFQSQMLYTLQDTDFGIALLDGSPIEPSYSAYKDFAAAHPDA